MTTVQLWKTHKSQLLLKIRMAVRQVHLQYFSLAVNAAFCGYSTLNITLISSPKGSALTRASLRGTALELKKEQAYTHTNTSCYILDYTVLFVVFKIRTMGLSYVFFIVFFASLICFEISFKRHVLFCFVTRGHILYVNIMLHQRKVSIQLLKSLFLWKLSSRCN